MDNSNKEVRRRGRPVIYKTPEEKAEARRARARRYYVKHKDEILRKHYYEKKAGSKVAAKVDVNDDTLDVKPSIINDVEPTTTTTSRKLASVHTSRYLARLKKYSTVYKKKPVRPAEDGTPRTKTPLSPWYIAKFGDKNANTGANSVSN